MLLYKAKKRPSSSENLNFGSEVATDFFFSYTAVFFSMRQQKNGSKDEKNILESKHAKSVQTQAVLTA